jgi:hypothetical protein
VFLVLPVISLLSSKCVWFMFTFYSILAYLMLLEISNRRQQSKWIRRHVTSRKVSILRPDEAIFSAYLILPATLGPGVH